MANSFDQFDQGDGNPFDRFDAPGVAVEQANQFDQFDAPDTGANPFDQFDDITLTGRAKESGKGFGRGLRGAIAAIPKGTAELLEGLGRKLGAGPALRVQDGRIVEATAADSAFYKMGEAIEGIGADALSADPEYADLFTTKLGEGLGAFAAIAATTAIAPQTLPARLAVGAGAGALMGGAEGAREAREAGIPEEDVFKTFLLNAGVGTSEVLPVTRLLNRLGPQAKSQVFNILRQGITGAVEEGGQEVGQQFLQNVIASKVVEYDPERNLFAGTKESGEVGGAVGAILNTVAASIGTRRGRGAVQEPPPSPAEGAMPVTEPAPAPPEGGVVPEAVIEPAVEPVVDAPAVPQPWEMSLSELEESLAIKKMTDEEIEISLFGEEGSRRYRKLERRANSIYATHEETNRASDEMAAMEDALTEQQQNRLFGVGETDVQVEDLKDYVRAIQDVDVDSPEAMGKSLRWAITKVGDKTNPADMRPEQQVAYATLQHAFREARRLGFDSAKVSAAALEASASRFTDPEDAMFMLRRFAKGEPPAQRQQPALQPPVTPIPTVEAPAAEIPKYAASINLERIEAPDDVKRVITQVAEANREFTGQRRGKFSHEATQALADSMGMTEKQLLKRRRGQALNAEEATAARALHVQAMDRLTETAAVLQKEGGNSDEQVAAFDRELARYNLVAGQVAGIATEAGRALSAHRIVVGSKTDRAKARALKELLEGRGGRERLEDIASKITGLDDPAQVAKFARDSFKATTFDKVYEVWINNLLSGPQTHVVNMTSNALINLWTQPEQLIAAGLGKVLPRAVKGDKVFVEDVLARQYGLVEGAKDGLRAFAHVVRTGDTTDPLTKLESVQHEAIKGPLGKVVRIPGRMLTAEDAFFKTIGYQMELRQLAMREAINRGLKGEKKAEFIAGVLRDPETVAPDLHLAAVDAGRYLTFTKPLGPAGQAINRFRNTVPGMRIVIPFLRTPVNIVKFAAERSPLGLVMKETRDNLMAGGAKRDVQLARMGLGTAVGVAIASLAADGLITGGAPQDENERRVWYQAGNQPYSIKVGDKWYAYGRLEPLGMILGISADLGILLKSAPEMVNDPEVQDATQKIAASILISASRNVTSKTWLRGVSDVIAAVNEPERYGERYLTGLLGTAIPTGVAQVARTQDPVLRDAQTAMEALKARIPGQSQKVRPRRDLFGQPIVREGGVGPDLFSPVYVRRAQDDPIATELLRLEVFPGRLGKSIGGVRLDADQYGAYQEVAGNFLHELLGKVVGSPMYQGQRDFAKERLMRKMIASSRSMARDYMMGIYPELRVERVRRKVGR